VNAPPPSGEPGEPGNPYAPDAPPPALLEWMEMYGGVRLEGDVESLAQGAIRALREALLRPGRDREGAYALLASDGLLTAAMEALASAEDPEPELRRLLARVGAEAGAASAGRGAVQEPSAE
jgi:hypothetical protein